MNSTNKNSHNRIESNFSTKKLNKKINKKEKQDNKQTSKDYSVFRSAEASLKKINFLERTIKNLRSIN
jgi:hypothetical protein